MRRRHTPVLVILAVPLLAQAPAPAPNSPAQPSDTQSARDAARAAHKAAMQRLAPLLGEWTAKGTYGTRKADGAFDEQVGSWSVVWMYEGAHLQIDFDVAVNNERRRYHAIFSYNPARDRYETTWTGDTGYRFTEAGAFDAAGRVLTLVSVHDFPSPAKQTRTESVFTFVDANTITVEDTSTDPETGTRERSFSVELKRKK